MDKTFGPNLNGINMNGPVFDKNTNPYSNGRAISVLEDGKILLCGDISTDTTSGYFIIKYNLDGSFDTTFGDNSSGYIVRVSDNNFFTPNSIIINSNKIYLGGSISSKDLITSNYIQYCAVICHNIDGSIVNTFGPTSNGLYKYRNSGIISNIKISNNYIIVSGYTNQILTPTMIAAGINNTNDIFISRLSKDGVLDTSFGTSGITITDLGAVDMAFSLDIDSNNKILVAGKTNKNGTDDFLVIRYLSSGLIDTTFGTNGIIIKAMSYYSSNMGNYSLSDIARGVVSLNDGKILVAGYSLSYDNNILTSNFILLKYNIDGITETNYPKKLYVNNYYSFNSIGVFSDNTILFAGTRNYNITLVKYNDNSTLDSTFGNNGKIISDFGSFNIPYDMIIKDDKCYLLGRSKDSILISKYTINGLLDTTFGQTSQGFTLTNFTKSYGNSLGIQSNNNLIVGGSVDDYAVLIKYSNNGFLDTTFGSDGKIITSFYAKTTTQLVTSLGLFAPILCPCKIAILEDDSIVGALTANDKITVFKYTKNGVLDRSFGTNGIIIFDKISNIDIVKAIKVLSDGSIIIGGLTDNKVFLIKLNSNGILDSKFGIKGILIINVGTTGIIKPTNGGYTVYSRNNLSMAVQNDNKIVVVGYILTEDGKTISFIMRINIDSTFDTTFGSSLNGINTFTSNGYFSSVTIQNSGKIIVGASYIIYNAVFCFMPDGKLDCNFNALIGGNTAIGNFALNLNTTGGLNTAIGSQSLYANTTGGQNIAIGSQ